MAATLQPVRRGWRYTHVLVALAILGMLITMGLSIFRSYYQRAQISEGFSLASQYKIFVSEYYVHQGHLPTRNEAMAMGYPPLVQGKYSLVSLWTRAGASGLRIEYLDNGWSTMSGKGIDLLPVLLSSGVVKWECRSGWYDLDRTLMPMMCR